jgi:hypothetical protein
VFNRVSFVDPTTGKKGWAVRVWYWHARSLHIHKFTQGGFAVLDERWHNPNNPHLRITRPLIWRPRGDG